MRLEDTPSHANFGSHPRQVVYREGLNIGYRYFCTHGVPTRFPFGHGLSYTAFTYSKLKVPSSLEVPSSSGESPLSGHKSPLEASTSTAAITLLEASLVVTNSGTVTASEIVQLYVRDQLASVYRPDRELKGFHKVVDLKPGQATTVTFTLDARAFAFYDVGAGSWYVESGAFEILVGASCEDIRLSATVKVTNPTDVRATVGGSDAPKRYTSLQDADFARLGLAVPPPEAAHPITANTTLHELSSSGWLASIFVQSLVIGAKQTASSGGATGLGEGAAAESVVVSGLLGSSLRSLQLMTSGMFTDMTIETLVHLFNGRPCAAAARLVGCGKTARLGGPAVDDEDLMLNC